MKEVKAATDLELLVNKIDSTGYICRLKQSVKTCKICNIKHFISHDWFTDLEKEFKDDYFETLCTKLHGKVFFPKVENIFTFTYFFPLTDTKVVILGQDPYHNLNQAMGLAFSVPNNVKIPPSLKNIFQELKNDILDFVIPKHGNLEAWAKQGVLLLNDVLTVEQHKPGSHSDLGWEIFTKAILSKINETCQNVVFIFWGNYARSKSKYVNKHKHLVLEAAHPSPFSAYKFFGCKHFSKTNEYLVKNGKSPINWNL